MESKNRIPRIKRHRVEPIWRTNEYGQTIFECAVCGEAVEARDSRTYVHTR